METRLRLFLPFPIDSMIKSVVSKAPGRTILSVMMLGSRVWVFQSSMLRLEVVTKDTFPLHSVWLEHMIQLFVTNDNFSLGWYWHCTEAGYSHLVVEIWLGFVSVTNCRAVQSSSKATETDSYLERNLEHTLMTWLVSVELISNSFSGK